MTDTHDANHRVPDDHTEDAKTDLDSAALGAQPHLLPILPILLGVFICGLNVFVGVLLWRSAYASTYSFLQSLSLPTTVSLSVMSISFGVGLFLIAYAIVLRRTERTSGADEGPTHVPSYVRWIVVPALVALPAPALTVWAAQMIEPIAPTPCIDLYQKAVEISKDAPNFKVIWTDRDQRRCNINSLLPAEER